jgi:hypothetical protein
VGGTITFEDGGKKIAVVRVTDKQATYSAEYGVLGTHAITALYSGDTANTSSTSPTLMEYIRTLPVTSTTVLTTSGSPSLVGQSVTFTATVTSKFGAIPDGELVAFFDGKTLLNAVPLTNGVAAYATSSLSARTHYLKAKYAGDPTFNPSAGPVQQIVHKYSTTTALRSSLNPSAHGQTVIFTAKVTSAGPAPTGRVVFKDGTLRIGSATLSRGVAKLTKSTLALGTHAITAEYLGDADSANSTSSVLNQVVQ